jgi:hypothetical protein
MGEYSRMSRYCRCGARLARDNTGELCGPCQRKAAALVAGAPIVPPEFWEIDSISDALTAWHMGRVVLAYRLHPHHSPPISQDIVAGWLNISAVQLGRYETGKPVTDLAKLIHWAGILRIPEHLLWFKLPSSQRATADAGEDSDHEGRGWGCGRPEPDTRPSARQPALPPAVTQGQGQHDQADQDHGLVSPDQLAALLEAGGGLFPVTGLLPIASASPSVPSLPPGQVTTLSTGRNLAFGDGRYQVIARFGEVLIVAVDRRLFMAGAGLAPGMAVQALDTEAARQGLARTMLGEGYSSAEAWQAIVREHYATYIATPPAEMFIRLSSDMIALRKAFSHERSESGQSELRKTGAFLTALLSSTLANLGDLPACMRWMQTARQMADASDDLHTRLWVRGREVVLGLYQRRPLGELLNIAEEGIAIGKAQGPPRTSAWPLLMAGTAQTLAVVGRRAEAEAALNRSRDGFEAVPDARRDGVAILSFSEHNMCFTEGYVYTYFGDYDKAGAAQSAALRTSRRPAEDELMQALCQARIGDTAAGVTHARDTIDRLPQAYRIRTIIDLGQKVLEAVPVEERRGDEAMALRELVGSGA